MEEHAAVVPEIAAAEPDAQDACFQRCGDTREGGRSVRNARNGGLHAAAKEALGATSQGLRQKPINRGESAAAMRLEHEHVADVTERGEVRNDARESDLARIPGVLVPQTEVERVLDRA